MSDSTNKIYPPASQEMANMLGIKAERPATPAPVTSAFPGNLPILDSEALVVEKVTEPQVSRLDPTEAMAKLDAEQETEFKASSENQALKIAKAVGPYILIFAIGIFLYYFFFSTFSFQSLLKSAPPAPVVTKTTALDQLKQNQSANYQKWIKQFYFDVSDASIIDPDTDNSGNGLTNFEKYLLGLNPKTYDTLGRGEPDGQRVVEGIDPTTGKQFTEDRLKIVQNYFDLEVISNRLTLKSFNGGNQSNTIYSQPIQQVAPSTDFRGGAPATQYYNSGDTDTSPTNSQPVNYQNTQPAQVNSQAPTPQPQTVVATQNPNPIIKQAQAAAPAPQPYEGDNRLGIDLSKSGTLKIPSLGITAPLIWSKSSKNFDTDLKNGVIHYPGTAIPGDTGTSYISGHSSNYSFIKSNYNYIFSKLGDLKDLESVLVTVTLKSGKQATLHYVVYSRGIFKPNDQKQFANTSDPEIALSTCWPPGTTADRLVVFAKLSQIEQ